MCATYSKLSEATQIDEFTRIKKKKKKKPLNVSASGFSAGDSHEWKQLLGQTREWERSKVTSSAILRRHHATDDSSSMQSPLNQSSDYRAIKTHLAAPSHQVTSSTPLCCGHRDWTESPASLSWLVAARVARSFIATPWEILPALHLALSRCTVWSHSLYYTVLDILLWRKLHKGAFLIIHGARFRFVPRCSGTENSPHCESLRELRIGFVSLHVHSSNP